MKSDDVLTLVLLLAVLLIVVIVMAFGGCGFGWFSTPICTPA